MESTNQNSPFFRIPLEIREMIYRESIRHDSGVLKLQFRTDVQWRLEEERGDNDDYPGHDADDETIDAWCEKNEQKDRVAIPPLNALAQTCRQAYFESSHLLYQHNSLVLDGPISLSHFVATQPPAHVRVIKELRMQTFGMDTWYDARPVADDPTLAIICPRNLKLLRAFRSLRTLHLKERYFRSCEPFRSSTQRLMNRVATCTSTLEALQTVTLTSAVFEENLQPHLRVTLDFDDVPGWAYCCETVFKMRRFEMIEITETLRRVHGPHAKPPQELAFDIFEDALGVFDGGMM